MHLWQPYSSERSGDSFLNTHFISTCTFGVIKNNEPWSNNQITRELYNCSGYTVWPPNVMNLSMVCNHYHEPQGI